MSLSCRPEDMVKAFLPRELWIEHIFPWCPKWWFDLPKVATPALGPFSPPLRTSSAAPSSPSFPPLPDAALAALTPLPCRVKGADGTDDDLSDDGGSTHVPS